MKKQAAQTAVMYIYSNLETSTGFKYNKDATRDSCIMGLLGQTFVLPPLWFLWWNCSGLSPESRYPLEASKKINRIS